ncbi:MAG TPA: hypothetical protein VK681_39360 [Reyranella sp.]|nr:hypothetical protein [Reyranella sp.]
MQLALSASGTPVQASNALETQISHARDANPEGQAAIDTVGDYLHAEIRKAGPEDQVTVECTIDAQITIVPAAKPAKEDTKEDKAE